MQLRKESFDRRLQLVVGWNRGCLAHHGKKLESLCFYFDGLTSKEFAFSRFCSVRTLEGRKSLDPHLSSKRKKKDDLRNILLRFVMSRKVSFDDVTLESKPPKR